MFGRVAIYALLLLFCNNVSYAGSAANGFADIVEPLIPAVVNVYTTHTQKKNAKHSPMARPHFPFEQFRDFFEQFDIPLDGENLKQNAKASGFIIDAEGHIVTNHHVIENADEIFVKCNDGQELKAKLIGSDQRTDLALLKLESKTALPFVQFGDSNKSRVGDWVIAIGNPFGLGGTVTAGIISSKGRDIALSEYGVVDDFIQTDAAINMGNSGGPMFNVNGEVIGVNTAIFAPGTGTNIGIGFAIPSSTVIGIVEQLKKNGKVSRGFLNIRIQDVNDEIAEGLGLSEVSGVLVFDVEEGGAGAKAGLKQGDVILAFNGENVKNARKLYVAVAGSPINSKAKILVLRNGQKIELDCAITGENDVVAANSRSLDVSVSKDSVVKNGVTFSNISKDLIKHYNLQERVHGVVVVLVNNASKRWGSFVQGDVVIAANQQPINNVADFEKIYQDAKKNNRKNIVLLVRRQGVTLFMALPL